MEMKDAGGETRRAVVSKHLPDKATVTVFDVRSRKKKTVGGFFNGSLQKCLFSLDLKIFCALFNEKL